MRYIVTSGHYGETEHYEGSSLAEARLEFSTTVRDIARDLESAMANQPSMSDFERDLLNLYNDGSALVAISSFEDGEYVETIESVQISNLI